MSINQKAEHSVARIILVDGTKNDFFQLCSLVINTYLSIVSKVLFVCDSCIMPSQSKTMDGTPEHVLGSMGVYVFKAGALREALQEPEDDFGKGVILKMKNIRKNAVLLPKIAKKGVK